ncbi:hypothetical protein HDV00_012460, partial [Rhizophlyctis rosea]
PTTFLESYTHTGRILNIPIVPSDPYAPSKLCNYITTPHVIIASVVVASSAVPGILNPVELKYKDPDTGEVRPFWGGGRFWRDGSLRTDVPEREVRGMWGVEFLVVSQVNPHVVLRGGFLSSFLTQYFKLSIQKYLTLLSDFDIVPRLFNAELPPVFLQSFEGSVTIVPSPSVNDYIRILTDPDEETLEKYVRGGVGGTWPKAGMIRRRMGVERGLREGWRECFGGEGVGRDV